MFARLDCICCRRPLRVPRCHRGRTVRCPACAATLVVAETLFEEPATPTGSKLRDRQTAHAAPARRCYASGRIASLRRPDAPPTSVAAAGGLVLPWLLLTPAIFALGLWMWAGQGLLWAGLGVGLGGLCLLLGQRGRWPLSVRIAGSLTLAIVGHGLTLADPLLNRPKESSIPRGSAGKADPSPNNTIQLVSPSQATCEASSLPDGLLHDTRDLRFVANLGDLLAVAVAPESADGGTTAFVTTQTGSLKEFSYPDFRLRTTYRLAQPAYRAVLDRRRGSLWMAACDPHVLRVNRHGDRPTGKGDLHVYNLPLSQGGRGNSDALLHPYRVLPLQGVVLELLVSPNPRWLFYLAQTDTGVHLGRINVERQDVDATLPLPAQTQALCLTPDGKALYAAGGGALFVIDPATLRQRQRLKLDADIHSIAADNDGRVYLGERGQWTNLTRLNLSGSTPSMRQWDAKLHGRVHVKLAPDQQRLYVGSSSVISNHLDSLLVLGPHLDAPLQVGMTVSDALSPIRGEFFVTPDGQFLVNRWGKVFRLVRKTNL